MPAGWMWQPRACVFKYASLFGVYAFLLGAWTHLKDSVGEAATVATAAAEDVWQVVRNGGVDVEKHQVGFYVLLLMVLIGGACAFVFAFTVAPPPRDAASAAAEQERANRNFSNHLLLLHEVTNGAAPDTFYPSMAPTFHFAVTIVLVALAVAYFVLFTLPPAPLPSCAVPLCNFVRPWYREAKFLAILYYYINYHTAKTHLISVLFKSNMAMPQVLMSLELALNLDVTGLVVLRGLIFLFETGKRQKGTAHLALVVVYAVTRIWLEPRTIAANMSLYVCVCFTVASFFALDVLCKRVVERTQRLLNGHPNTRSGESSVDIVCQQGAAPVAFYYNTVFYLTHDVLAETSFVAELMLFSY